MEERGDDEEKEDGFAAHERERECERDENDYHQEDEEWDGKRATGKPHADDNEEEKSEESESCASGNEYQGECARGGEEEEEFSRGLH